MKITLQEMADKYNCTMARAAYEILCAEGRATRTLPAAIRKQRATAELADVAQRYYDRLAAANAAIHPLHPARTGKHAPSGISVSSIRKAMAELGVGELAASHNAGSRQPTIAMLTRAAKALGRGKGPGNASRSLPGGRTIGEVLERAARIEDGRA